MSDLPAPLTPPAAPTPSEPQRPDDFPPDLWEAMSDGLRARAATANDARSAAAIEIDAIPGLREQAEARARDRFEERKRRASGPYTEPNDAHVSLIVDEVQREYSGECVELDRRLRYAETVYAINSAELDKAMSLATFEYVKRQHEAAQETARQEREAARKEREAERNADKNEALALRKADRRASHRKSEALVVQREEDTALARHGAASTRRANLIALGALIVALIGLLSRIMK